MPWLNSTSRKAAMDDMMHAQGGRCYYCEKPMRRDVRSRHPDRATIEHRVPVCQGGRDRSDNIVAACRTCNIAKGSMSEDAFRSALSDRPAPGIGHNARGPLIAGQDYETGEAAPSNEELDHDRVVFEMMRPRTREVFLLSRVDGLKYEQIARELRMTVWGVRRHMLKAITHLCRYSYEPSGPAPA